MTLLRQLEHVAERYASSHRVAVAGFLAHHPRIETFELFESSPALGLLLSHCDHFLRYTHEEPWNEAHRMVLRPRSEILAWLGFPASKSAVRIVGKVDVSRVSADRLVKLRKIMSTDDVSQRLRHLPAICDGLIDLLADEQLRCLASYSLLEELCQHTDDDAIAAEFFEIKQLAYLHHVKLRKFNSCSAIHQSNLALQLMEEWIRPEWRTEYQNIDFPEPPIPVPVYTQPNDLRIEPIRSPFDLFEEAKAQRICVFQRLEEVACGKAAIYRILKPERATLMLTQDSLGSWVITEFRATRNSPVNKDTVLKVGAYLTRRQERIANGHIMQTCTHCHSDTDSLLLP